MLTKKEVKQLRTLITEWCNAEIEESWKGAGDPDDKEMLEDRKKQACQKLDTFIEQLKEV